MAKEMKYRFVMFKLKGHETWRVTAESSFLGDHVLEVTEKKIIEIDRMTGKVVTKVHKNEN